MHEFSTVGGPTDHERPCMLETRLDSLFGYNALAGGVIIGINLILFEGWRVFMVGRKNSCVTRQSVLDMEVPKEVIFVVD